MRMSVFSLSKSILPIDWIICSSVLVVYILHGEYTEVTKVTENHPYEYKIAPPDLWIFGSISQV